MRYPASYGKKSTQLCPLCRAPTRIVQGIQLDREPYRGRSRSTIGLEGFLDNLRSAWNVGSILRTADGLGLQHIYHVGTTPAGDHPKVVKTALGAEKCVQWSYHRNGLDLATQLISQGKRLWALEWIEQAVPISTLRRQGADLPIVLVVGNEVTGIDPELLDLCEVVVGLPMQGAKRSFNVAVAFGMAVYGLRLRLEDNLS